MRSGFKKERVKDCWEKRVRVACCGGVQELEADKRRGRHECWEYYVHLDVYTLILLAGVRIVEVVAISLEKRKKIDDVFRPRATYCYVFFLGPLKWHMGTGHRIRLCFVEEKTRSKRHRGAECNSEIKKEEKLIFFLKKFWIWKN